MRKISKLFSLIFVTLIFILFTNNKAYATVGGPRYISHLSYDPLSEIVYYLLEDYGMSGCPPTIHAIDLSRGIDSVLKNCEQIRNEFDGFTQQGDNDYLIYIDKFFNDKEPLGSIDLVKNKIEIQVNPISYTYYEGDSFPMVINFQALISQEDKGYQSQEFSGCEKDQPNIFEGYMIPDTNYMVLLFSHINDCFEGGYIYEEAHLMKNVEYYDTTIIKELKTGDPIEPDNYNLTVFSTPFKIEGVVQAEETPQEPIKVVDPKPTYYKIIILGFYGLITFVMGVFIGVIFYRKTFKPKS